MWNDSIHTFEIFFCILFVLKLLVMETVGLYLKWNFLAPVKSRTPLKWACYITSMLTEQKQQTHVHLDSSLIKLWDEIKSNPTDITCNHTSADFLSIISHPDCLQVILILAVVHSWQLRHCQQWVSPKTNTGYTAQWMLCLRSNSMVSVTSI